MGTCVDSSATRPLTVPRPTPTMMSTLTTLSPRENSQRTIGAREHYYRCRTMQFRAQRAANQGLGPIHETLSHTPRLRACVPLLDFRWSMGASITADDLQVLRCREHTAERVDLAQLHSHQSEHFRCID